jgi:ABC-type multidrug transport system ATPase subunit
VHDLELEAHGLTKRFGKVLALDDVDLRVSPRDSVAILGDAAAGKSTVLRCAAGLVRPSGGSIALGGVDPRSSKGLAVRRRLGYLGQEPGFYDWMTGGELLAFAAELLGVERREAPSRVDETLERVGLRGDRDRRIADYALPLRQRLGVAQALIGDPDLLLLDEPLGWLDPASRSELLELLVGLRGSRSMVIATSDVALAEMACERVVVLDRGRVLADSPTASLLDGVSSRDYVVETVSGAGLALAGLAARLSHEAWVAGLWAVDGTLRISVRDDVRADRELLPAVVATGVHVRALRRERPQVAAVVERLRDGAE